MSAFVKYEKNKIFITLTLILIIAIFILIKECDYPLLFDSPFLYRVFTHQYSEKILYNISISYIVTYIFYVIQLYIPATIRNRKALTILRPSIHKEINYLKYALCILSASTYIQNEDIYVKQDLTLPFYINIKKENANYLRRFSYGSSLSKLKESSFEVKNAINSSNCLNDLDSYIATLLTNLPLENIFSVLEQVALNINNNCPFKFADREIISNIQKQINLLECIPKISSLCTCTINKDTTLHSKYDNELNSNQLDEYIYTINMP